MAEAFIKLHRKMLDWEWFDNLNVFRLFMYCLLKANWKQTKWHGIEVEAGQFITSLSTLSDETGLTIQQVRTALSHLKTTGELTDYQQGKYRIITVNNWGSYQGDNRVDNREITGYQQDDNNLITGCQQDDNRMVTTDKEYKEYKEYKELKESKEVKEGKEKKHIYGEYKHVKLTDKERDQLFNDYGEADTLKAIKYLDEYIEMKGAKYKSHYLAMKKWVFDAVSRGSPEKQAQSLAEKWGLA